MLDQAAALRKLAKEAKEKEVEEKELEQSSKGPKIITVTSGKGGVGKSNFVVNLSIALQMRGKKVLIFDADVGMGNDDVLMGFLPKYDVKDVIFNNMEIEDVIIEGPYGVRLLPGGSGFTAIEDISKEKRDKFLRKLASLENLDYIIMDTGAGVSRNVLGFIACSEELIVITTPEPTSLTDAYCLLKVINHFKIKTSAKVVINKIMSFKEGMGTYNKFNNTVSKFLDIKLDYLGALSEDKKLIEAVRKQKPFVISFPNAEVSKEINDIATKILGEKNKKKGTGAQGLFKKLFSIFS
ncbi:MinD/ParA family protein [Clostridium sp. MSJ-11]|uniref:MinD/ParA family protein n=1 Tax=Clostridium mobile TaxID=2841512 RepID=A0ABS6ECV4_9CLOT|nr:MinD/ParA family protein [Clostridium mobile]MBU5483019.1 MinD/ParA family protein [Clostridium mobile]